MEIVLIFTTIGCWIWTIARGIEISIWCVILNALFPPVSQIVFSLYESRMRLPLISMLLSGGAMFYLYGETTVVSGTVEFE
jgi:hypothetical protein